MEQQLMELRLDSLQNQMKWLMQENQILQQRVTLLEKSSSKASLPGFQTVTAPVTFGSPYLDNTSHGFGSSGPGFGLGSASFGSMTGPVPGGSFTCGSLGASASVSPPQ